MFTLLLTLRGNNTKVLYMDSSIYYCSICKEWRRSSPSCPYRSVKIAFSLAAEYIFVFFLLYIVDTVREISKTLLKRLVNIFCTRYIAFRAYWNSSRQRWKKMWLFNTLLVKAHFINKGAILSVLLFIKLTPELITTLVTCKIPAKV